MSHCIACYVKEKETDTFPDDVVKLVDEKGEALSSVSGGGCHCDDSQS